MQMSGYKRSFIAIQKKFINIYLRKGSFGCSSRNFICTKKGTKYFFKIRSLNRMSWRNFATILHSPTNNILTWYSVHVTDSPFFHVNVSKAHLQLPMFPFFIFILLLLRTHLFSLFFLHSWKCANVIVWMLNMEASWGNKNNKKDFYYSWIFWHFWQLKFHNCLLTEIKER